MNYPVKGARMHGFTVISSKFVPSVNTTVIHLVHNRTGYEVVHLANDDRENLFSFVVNTPCSDDTGVAHIMEHSVLSGSKKYPLKDPFVQLLKGSMKTLMNASTGMDETQFYAASTDERDFFNLMSVYGDAVFSPLLREEVFMQEGIRIDTVEEDGRIKDLKFVGVVYNEMTGRYSHPESAVSDFSIRSLFPDNEYRFESGGEPLAITGLTYEQFIGFYGTYYHPSNMKLYIYGNIETEKTVSFVEREYLSRFERKRINGKVSAQRRWKEPRVMKKAYPVEEGEKNHAKSFVSLNWLAASSLDPRLVLAFELLQEILVGNPGSPLRKTLQESALGEDILPSTGLAVFLEDMIFTVGLRGSGQLDARQIDMLVTRVLVDLAKGGIDRELIDAALNRIEFRNRESNLDGNYRGIRLFNKIMRPWSCGIDPSVTLDFDRWIRELKISLARKPKFLERLVEKYFLRNRHRSLLSIEPDPEIAAREKAELAQRLSIVAGDEHALAGIREKKARFDAFQATPDSEEALRTIPTLRVADLPQIPPSIPIEEIGGTGLRNLCYHDIFTNGIVYIDFVFDVSDLDPSLFDYVNVFGKAVSSCGLPGVPYDRAARELSLLTGGFYVSFDTDYIAGTDTTRSILIFRLKALVSKLERALGLVVRLIKSADFTNTDRMKDILFELRNRYKSSITPSGNYYAGVRAGSHIALPYMIEERVSGLSQVRFLSSLLADPASGVKEAIGELTRMRDHAISKEQLSLNVTCERSVFDKVRHTILESIAALQETKQVSGAVRKYIEIPDTRLESIAFPAGVCFNAVALQGAPYESDSNTIESVLAHLISTDFLWEQVRQQGGAYGAHASSSGMAAAFIFSSYRDPNIVSTIGAFRKSLELIRDGQVTMDEVSKAIIGTVANAEKPYPPGEKALVSLKRLLFRITDEARQKRRSIVLGCTVGDLAKAADYLLSKYDDAYTVTIASRDKIGLESSKMPSLLSSITDFTV